jgi:GNAT superfamily N-acetyltransferase
VIEHVEAPPHVWEGLPSAFAIAAVLLARLAVTSKAKGEGYGSLLLADAARRALAVAEQAGVRVLLVHSLDEARGFYAHHGFQPSPTHERHMMMLIQDIAESLPGESAR